MDAQEKIQWERQAYGATIETLKNAINRSYKFYEGTRRGTKNMLVTSWLSDAQELIEMGQDENARQLINQVKWIVNHLNEDGSFSE